MVIETQTISVCNTFFQLFGPKWSSNMPKYAANLSNAPLQPQKQVSIPSSIVSQPEVVAEKSSSKPTTWSDPFTSDGQECECNKCLIPFVINKT